jgi:hypothetical protein
MVDFIDSEENRNRLALVLRIKPGDTVNRFKCAYSDDLQSNRCLTHDVESPYSFEFGPHRPCWRARLEDKLPLTIIQFLQDRASEARRRAENSVLEEDHTKIAEIITIILNWHDQWPVMVSEPPTFEYDAFDPLSPMDQITYHMTQKIDWMTTQAYKERFGTESPVAPLIRQLAQMWSYHPDYQEEWRIGQ